MIEDSNYEKALRVSGHLPRRCEGEDIEEIERVHAKLPEVGPFFPWIKTRRMTRDEVIEEYGDR